MPDRRTLLKNGLLGLGVVTLWTDSASGQTLDATALPGLVRIGLKGTVNKPRTPQAVALAHLDLRTPVAAFPQTSLQITTPAGQGRKLTLAALKELLPLEERVYSWQSEDGEPLVLPWIGWPLQSLLARLSYGQGVTAVRFSGTGFVSRLRAVDGDTLLAVGLYGRALSPALGGPVRLIQPDQGKKHNLGRVTRLSVG